LKRVLLFYPINCPEFKIDRYALEMRKMQKEFAKKRQAHSCVSYPIENHFKNKDNAKALFTFLIEKIEEDIGPVKIESLPCCIHMVSNYTFGAVWAMKDRIRIDFRTNFQIESSKIWKVNQISPNRYIYYFDIKDKKSIDKNLLGWIKNAYRLNYKD
jgi:hypothetical protein